MTKFRELILIGASSLPGKELRESLNDSLPEINHFRLMDEAGHQGELCSLRDEPVVVTGIDPDVFAPGQIVVNALPGPPPADLVQRAVLAGASWIDLSGGFTANPAVPLIVPVINGGSVSQDARVIASPRPLAVILSLAAAPLHAAWGLRRCVGTVLLGHSFHSQESMDELFEQTRQLLNFQALPQSVRPFQVAFSAFPDMDGVDATGVSAIERDLDLEIARVLALEDFSGSFTAVWIPTFIGCGISVQLQFSQAPTIKQAEALLASQAYLRLAPLESGAETLATFRTMGEREICVGKLRTDPSAPNGLNLWLTADNLRSGAAANVIDICELLNRQAP